MLRRAKPALLNCCCFETPRQELDLHLPHMLEMHYHSATSAKTRVLISPRAKGGLTRCQSCLYPWYHMSGVDFDSNIFEMRKEDTRLSAYPLIFILTYWLISQLPFCVSSELLTYHNASGLISFPLFYKQGICNLR